MFYPSLFSSMFDSLEVLSGLEAYEQDESLVIKMELPGYEKGKISVSAERGVLTVTASRDEETKGRKYLVQSRSSKSVSRQIGIPEAYDESKADAGYDSGVLTITLPKREEAKGRRIEIR